MTKGGSKKRKGSRRSKRMYGGVTYTRKKQDDGTFEYTIQRVGTDAEPVDIEEKLLSEKAKTEFRQENAPDTIEIEEDSEIKEKGVPKEEVSNKLKKAQEEVLERKKKANEAKQAAEEAIKEADVSQIEADQLKTEIDTKNPTLTNSEDLQELRQKFLEQLKIVLEKRIAVISAATIAKQEIEGAKTAAEKVVNLSEEGNEKTASKTVLDDVKLDEKEINTFAEFAEEAKTKTEQEVTKLEELVVTNLPSTAQPAAPSTAVKYIKDIFVEVTKDGVKVIDKLPTAATKSIPLEKVLKKTIPGIMEMSDENFSGGGRRCRESGQPIKKCYSRKKSKRRRTPRNKRRRSRSNQ